ncbi:MAG: hypothetical protein D084_Lepto4C00410G0004 [Leptospirillum sp. Group IV 'UBA BS']|nr:MAG: hypothetical protein D084_Lepto4C00410G0004 [Leptospirillum sp. Group IV 'UBA BS']
MHVFLVRHGATEWSVSGRHTGRTDLPLTPQGEAEARHLAPLLHSLAPRIVLSSPLSRARRTAELAGFGECLRLDPDLAEWDYGLYEGRTTLEICRDSPGWDLFRDGAPRGESLEDVARRVRRVLGRLEENGEDALLFAHGHLLRVLVANWLRLPSDSARHFAIETCSLTILGNEHSWPALLALNRKPVDEIPDNNSRSQRSPA